MAKPKLRHGDYGWIESGCLKLALQDEGEIRFSGSGRIGFKGCGSALKPHQVEGNIFDDLEAMQEDVEFDDDKSVKAMNGTIDVGLSSGENIVFVTVTGENENWQCVHLGLKELAVLNPYLRRLEATLKRRQK